MVMTEAQSQIGQRSQQQGSFGNSQFNYSGQSFEQVQESSQRLYNDVRQSLTQASATIVRYANLVRPGVNPAELLMAVDSALQTCAEATLRRIDPQTGRIRALPNPQQPWNTQPTISSKGGKARSGNRR